MSLVPGQKISGFTVVGSLGVGGMGEVYRARDPRLERDVAIKVLPASWYEDASHAQRFEREARTLASLNHPNVGQVYSFAEADGMRLLVLELVEGEDLSARVARGPLPLRETIGICLQIAEGLEAAHELGVVHRDLKPGNVRVTSRDAAKILDFGLAKSLRPSRGSDSSSGSERDPTFHTQDGSIVGTPAYMSPEQVRAKEVDRRTDIWAFGCVLYECLTGRLPFQGESVADTLAAVVQQEPDLSQLPANTPPAIRTLIARCLDKNPRTRLRDIGEARLVLAGDLPAATPAVPTGSARRGIPLPAVLLTALGLVLATWYAAGRPSESPPGDRWATANYERVTDFPGTEHGAAISRDGKFIAFVADLGGETDVWIAQVGGSGELRNLTRGRRDEWWSPGIRDIGFDLEETHVWLSGGKGRRLQTVSIMGGDLYPQFDENVVNPDWSPDRTRLVYHLGEDGDPLFVANPDGSGAERISILPKGMHQHFATWSADGRWIYLVRGLPSTFEMDLWRIRPDGSDEEQLTRGLTEVGYPTPLDGHTVLFTARESDGAGPWLYELDHRVGEPRRVRAGVSQYLSIAASEDKRTLVASAANLRSQLSTLPILADGVAGEEHAERYKGLETVRAQTPRFAGGRLFYLAPRNAGGGLWCHDDGKPVPILRGDDAPLLRSYAVSADGKSVAVLLQRRGQSRLHVIEGSGSVPREISGDVAVRGTATWSPDGGWVAISGEDTEGPGLFLFPRDGGEYRRIAAGTALNPVWSPTDDLIVYCGPQEAGWLPVLGVRPSDDTPVELPPINVPVEGERVRFMPDGQGLVYMHGSRGGMDLRLLDLGTRTERPLARLTDHAEMLAFDIDPSRASVVFDRRHLNSDIVLITLGAEDGTR